MNHIQKKEFLSLIDKYSKREGINETPIPSVFCYKATTVDALTPTIYDPSLCVVAQGRKQVMLNKEIYCYGPSEYLAISVDLPMIGQVTEASVKKPYLCLKVDIDVQLLSELLVQTNSSNDKRLAVTSGLFVGKLHNTAGDSLLRLARLMDAPDDIPFLAPTMLREVYYRLLKSDYGNTVAQLALKDSHMRRVALAIQKIKSELHQTLRVKELADLAGMSASSFHTHFKSVTTMSPLQFQKRLRLIEARNIMLSGNVDAADTAYRVGYESPSQFSREYARLFGSPPARDISSLRQQKPEPPLHSGS